MTRVLVLLALASCAPFHRLTTPRGPRCLPTSVQYEADFSITVVLLALSVLSYNTGHYVRSGIELGAGMGLAVADNYAETTCR